MHTTTTRRRAGVRAGRGSVTPGATRATAERMMPGPGGNLMPVERCFALFGSVIPASSGESGRGRTAFFYRQMAIQLRRDIRSAWTADMRETFTRLAKYYLAEYRKRIAARRAA